MNSHASSSSVPNISKACSTSKVICENSKMSFQIISNHPVRTKELHRMPWHVTGRECCNSTRTNVVKMRKKVPKKIDATMTQIIPHIRYTALFLNKMRHTTKVQAIKAMAFLSFRWCRTASRSVAIPAICAYKASLRSIGTI